MLISYARALNGTGFEVVGGLCPTVGVVGFTLGGGVSILSRSWGLAIDNLICTIHSKKAKTIQRYRWSWLMALSCRSMKTVSASSLKYLNI